MPRKPAQEARTTIYRTTALTTLDEAIQEKYRDSGGFASTPVAVGGRNCLLVTGSTPRKTASWGPLLSNISGVEVDLDNTVAAAVLIIPTEDGSSVPATTMKSKTVHFEEETEDYQEVTDQQLTPGENTVSMIDAWVLTYGLGFQLLNQARVDPGFGQRVAIRSARPNDLNSISRVTLDARSRVERLSVPAGVHLRGLGGGDLGEIVTRLVASASIPGLSGPEEVKVRGADSLSLPLARDPKLLVADLDAVSEVLEQDPVNADLALLEQLVRVKDEELVSRLDKLLIEAVRDGDSPLLASAWPHERVDDVISPNAYKIFGDGRTDVQDGVPDLNSLLGPVRSEAEPDQLSKLDRMSVILFRDEAGEDACSPKIPLRKWLSFQVDDTGRRYCLHDGRWFLIEKTYADHVREQTESIFARDHGLAVLPPWPAGNAEDEYNKILADHLDGIVLDRKLLRSDFHRYGIEACDVLLKDNTFVHVKLIESSAPASHLIAQALVSVETLTYDLEAQAAFRERVDVAGWDGEMYSGKPKRVVLVLARVGKSIDAASLFTFTQVNLWRQVSQLGSQGVEVFVAPVEKEKE